MSIHCGLELLEGIIIGGFDIVNMFSVMVVVPAAPWVGQCVGVAFIWGGAGVD